MQVLFWMHTYVSRKTGEITDETALFRNGMIN